MRFLVSCFLLGSIVACSPLKDAKKRITHLSNPKTENISPAGKSFSVNRDGNTYVMTFAEKIVSLRILKSKGTEIYTGDYIQKNNFISVRLDMLNNEKIPLPMVYNMKFVESEGSICLQEINNSQCWLTTK